MSSHGCISKIGPCIHIYRFFFCRNDRNGMISPTQKKSKIIWMMQPQKQYVIYSMWINPRRIWIQDILAVQLNLRIEMIWIGNWIILMVCGSHCPSTVRLLYLHIFLCCTLDFWRQMLGRSCSLISEQSLALENTFLQPESPSNLQGSKTTSHGMQWFDKIFCLSSIWNQITQNPLRGILL